MKLIEKYKALVEVTEAMDLADRATIKRSNKAVDGMYALVRSISGDLDAIKELALLLDDEIASKWLAHQLVECVKLPKTIENKCFVIIEELAKDDSSNDMGERIWLEEWKAKKGRA